MFPRREELNCNETRRGVVQAESCYPTCAEMSAAISTTRLALFWQSDVAPLFSVASPVVFGAVFSEPAITRLHPTGGVCGRCRAAPGLFSW